LTSACCQEAAKQPKLNSEMERCRRINNEHMRMYCLEQINSKAASVPQQQPTASGTWQLARTPNPSGGPDSISISKVVNPTPSQQEVAGLMLRCAEGATTDVLIVLAAPLPPRTHPKVTVVAGATTTEFIATVMPPGALVLLPEKRLAIHSGAYRVHHGQKSCPARCNTARRHQQRNAGIAVELSESGSWSQVGGVKACPFAALRPKHI
jgi:hypothetical protein